MWNTLILHLYIYLTDSVIVASSVVYHYWILTKFGEIKWWSWFTDKTKSLGGWGSRKKIERQYNSFSQNINVKQ